MYMKILRKAADAVRLPRLSPAEKLLMIVWGVLLAQLAAPIGSAIYYLGTQVTYQAYPKGGKPSAILGSSQPGDWWDRLPNHLGLVHSARAPSWWVTARHDFRHVFIGILVILLSGTVTVGFKKYKTRTPRQIALSVPAAFLVAGAVATGLILFFNRYAEFINSWGVRSGNQWVQNWVGSGTLAVTAIGIIAGFPAKKSSLPRSP